MSVEFGRFGFDTCSRRMGDVRFVVGTVSGPIFRVSVGFKKG